MPARAKLPPGKGKRVPLNVRTTRETREKLEKRAAGSGRSLVQELEYIVEQSFLDEEARDREWGGKKLHGLFRMMVGALEVIEQDRGKTCADDWGALSAVKEAWETLLFINLAPKDQPFGAFLESIGGPPEDFEMPALPTPPKHPMAESGFPLSAPSEERMAAFEEEYSAYEKESVRWHNEANKYRERLDAAQQHLDDMKKLGTKTVLEMFSTGTRD